MEDCKVRGEKDKLCTFNFKRRLNTLDPIFARINAGMQKSAVQNFEAVYTVLPRTVQMTRECLVVGRLEPKPRNWRGFQQQ